MKITTHNFRPVHYWGYEWAYVDNIFFTFDRDHDWDVIQHHLSTWAKVNLDNKVVFKLEHVHKPGEFLYIGFKDFSVHIGTGVRPYHGNTLVPGKAITT